MFAPDRELQIGTRKVGQSAPVLFIADIAANHDGDLERAKDLIGLAAAAGADVAKFQHFKADTIVSDYGFKSLGAQRSHQSKWPKAVSEVYRDAELNAEWSAALKQSCDQAGIIFMSSPYDFELVDRIDPYVPAHKIGSGDISWIEIVEYIAAKQKPCLLASGASSLDDVDRAVSAILRINPRVALMQCNTNYTASLDNFRHIQLNVLKTYRTLYPDMVLGLSDHTPGHATVLGAIALEARIIEKHFTDDTSRSGPDHAFSMDPKGWREMVERSRELELALGCGIKRVEQNEQETAVLQRRGIRVVADLAAGTVLKREHLLPLRPCPLHAIPPYLIPDVVGRSLNRDIQAGEHLRWNDISWGS
ncbi:MAG: N-acetylneuraminate synthase family protein [Magnetococcales bacterium]|nr:N-acetylneuraminate synthase family protein [Magnetococcales bacterium]